MADKLTMGGDVKRYWFRAKTRSIGWEPSAWQGWLVTIGHIGFVFFIMMRQTVTGSVYAEASLQKIILPIALATITLILICVRTGEPLKWRWEKKQWLKN